MRVVVVLFALVLCHVIDGRGHEIRSNNRRRILEGKEEGGATADPAETWSRVMSQETFTKVNGKCATTAGTPEKGSGKKPGVPRPRTSPFVITKEQLMCSMRILGFDSGPREFTDAQGDRWVGKVNHAIQEIPLTTAADVAAFLAITGKETGSYSVMGEIESSACKKYHGGCKYKGRGPTQLTHDCSYFRVYAWLSSDPAFGGGKYQDIYSTPSLVETDDEIAMDSAIAFWAGYASMYYNPIIPRFNRGYGDCGFSSAVWIVAGCNPQEATCAKKIDYSARLTRFKRALCCLGAKTDKRCGSLAQAKC